MNPLRSAVILAAVAASPITPVWAVTAWDESVSGDLSNLPLGPTAVTVGFGANEIIGTTGDVGAGTDLDYFTITVPAGLQLASLFVLPGTGPESLAFIGIEAGTQITGSSANVLLGWTHYGSFDAGTDILPRMGNGAGAIGFAPPLPAGDYAFWVQDFDFGVSPYAFQLVLVPEPASALMLAAGLAALAWRRLAR